MEKSVYKHLFHPMFPAFTIIAEQEILFFKVCFFSPHLNNILICRRQQMGHIGKFQHAQTTDGSQPHPAPCC